MGSSACPLRRSGLGASRESAVYTYICTRESRERPMRHDLKWYTLACPTAFGSPQDKQNREKANLQAIREEPGSQHKRSQAIGMRKAERSNPRTSELEGLTEREETPPYRTALLLFPGTFNQRPLKRAVSWCALDIRCSVCPQEQRNAERLRPCP